MMTETDLLTGSRTTLAIACGLSSLNGARVVRAYPGRLEILEKATAKVAKHAAALGCTAPTWNVLGEEQGGILRIAIYGLAPRLEGWTFLARIEHTAEGNLVSVPFAREGFSGESYRACDNTCDHCGKARNRRDTFVLAHTDGRIVRVGRSCLADFIRSADVTAALKVWELIQDMCADGEGEEFFGGGSRGDCATSEFLAFAVAAIRTDGFHKSGDDRSTRGRIGYLMGRPPKDARDVQSWQDGQPTDADRARAEAVRAFCCASEEPGDYMWNLRLACRLPGVGRNGGLLASAPVAYARHVERLVKAARSAPEAPTGVHVGAIGKRQPLGDLTVVRVRYSDGDYGTTTIMSLTDAAGNSLVWFASGSRDVNAGDVLLACKGTPKAHGEFRGMLQTTVSRLAFDGVTKAAEPVAS